MGDTNYFQLLCTRKLIKIFFIFFFFVTETENIIKIFIQDFIQYGTFLIYKFNLILGKPKPFTENKGYLNTTVH